MLPLKVLDFPVLGYVSALKPASSSVIYLLSVVPSNRPSSADTVLGYIAVKPSSTASSNTSLPSNVTYLSLGVFSVRHLSVGP